MVVVLGTTGRNFAAGMSGGVAYVLDEDGTLRRRAATMGMVELEPLEPQDERARCATLIERHFELHRQRAWPSACSTTGREARAQFVKVMPTRLQARARRAAATTPRSRRWRRVR